MLWLDLSEVLVPNAEINQVTNGDIMQRVESRGDLRTAPNLSSGGPL